MSSESPLSSAVSDSRELRLSETPDSTACHAAGESVATPSAGEDAPSVAKDASASPYPTRPALMHCGPDGPKEPGESLGAADFRHGLVAGTRFMAAIPSLGLLVAALTLTIRTLVEVCTTTLDVVHAVADMQSMLVSYIECADFFLLSIVLYIMAIGLYALFIDPEIHMPAWLEIRNLDDLKEKLVGVIVVVMGVYFLGQLIHGSDTLDLLCMGVGIGAVTVSLAYFVRHVISGSKSRRDGR